MQRARECRQFYAACLLLLLILSATTASADEPSSPAEETKASRGNDEFPGTGRRKKWLKANKEYNRGVKLAGKKQYQEAAVFFKRACTIYPYDSWFYENLGVALRECKDFNGAKDATNKAIAIDDRRWRPWFNLASILAQAHQYDEAESAARKALSLKPPKERQAEMELLLDSLRAQKQKEK